MFGGGGLISNNGALGGMFQGMGDSLGINFSGIPFIGGMFPNPAEAAANEAIRQAAGVYGGLIPQIAQAYGNLHQNALGNFGPVQNALRQIYGGDTGMGGAPVGGPNGRDVALNRQMGGSAGGLTGAFGGLPSPSYGPGGGLLGGLSGMPGLGSLPGLGGGGMPFGGAGGLPGLGGLFGGGGGMPGLPGLGGGGGLPGIGGGGGLPGMPGGGGGGGLLGSLPIIGGLFGGGKGGGGGLLGGLL